MRGCALRYLSVDLFKTLIYPKEDIAITYTRFGQKHLQFEFNEHEVSNQLINACSAIGEKWPNFGRNDQVSPRLWWSEVIIQIFARCSPFHEEQVRNALSGGIINDFYDWFATSDAWCLLPGTIQELEKINSAGIKLAICSNSDERTPIIMKSLGLDEFFEFTVYSHDCDFMKPNPGMFELVCKRFMEMAKDKSDLKCCMKYCGHVGDSESRDYWGARNAGFGRAFLFKPKVEDHGPWPRLGSQSGLLDGKVPAEDIISELGQVLDR